MNENIEDFKKKRILIPIVGQGSIIHIIRTGMLDKLAEFCEPVIGLLWEQPDLAAELEGKGYEVYLMPQFNVAVEYRLLKLKIDFWYRKFRVKTPSVKIQQQYLAQFKQKSIYSYKKQIKESILKARLMFQPDYIKSLLAKEESVMKQQQSFDDYKAWLEKLNIETFFTVTPFLPEADLIARILRGQGKKIIASIHSFDNVTKRGWASTFFDHYIVWNNYNKSELERIHPPIKEHAAVTIAGAPQFDFHFNEDYSWSKEEWLERHHLPKNKKIILYAGGPVALLPEEPQYLQHLNEAFENGEISDDNIILFRCHPLDNRERWLKAIAKSKHIYLDEAPHGTKKPDQVNVVLDDVKKLMSTLKHCDIHINVVSTMTVDGSAFNKPQIGPYYDAVRPNTEGLLREMYNQEHYRPIMKSGVVNLAKTKKDYIKLVNDALSNPSNYHAGSEACIKEIITYNDGQSTNRAVTAIKSFLLQ
jgi:hypothetical protein